MSTTVSGYEPYAPTNQAWKIPAADAVIFSEKTHRHVLVIPVINEGERIRRQLEEIAATNPNLDIIIADGGSDDGSLEENHLRQCGVRALLVKRGPGRLSAQLRMAYAWALDQGYEGILTMDGNGKDGPEALPHFVQALEEGHGYVQGSRYLKGAEAINTPLERKIAGRIIHAPVISLAAMHWFTDTTNGFRAYSRTYLLDPKVQPFREIFERYSLLFYLSSRATQIGYTAKEIPVRRGYPAGEKPPTKIAGFKGKMDMMGELFAVLGSTYKP